jgi:hypothetical protein
VSATAEPPEGLQGYEIIESDDRVPTTGGPWFQSRFRWRAERRARDLNASRVILSYTCRVVRERGRWVVVAFQNYLRSVDG